MALLRSFNTKARTRTSGLNPAVPKVAFRSAVPLGLLTGLFYKDLDCILGEPVQYYVFIIFDCR